jgi:hypothetical protein
MGMSDCQLNIFEWRGHKWKGSISWITEKRDEHGKGNWGKMVITRSR